MCRTYNLTTIRVAHAGKVRRIRPIIPALIVIFWRPRDSCLATSEKSTDARGILPMSLLSRGSKQGPATHFSLFSQSWVFLVPEVEQRKGVTATTVGCRGGPGERKVAEEKVTRGWETREISRGDAWRGSLIGVSGSDARLLSFYFMPSATRSARLDPGP